MTGNWVDFRELRSKLRFADVLESFSVELKVTGDRATGFCPLPGHNGQRRSPSFSANLARGIFQCFGCGAKGNVLDFAALMRGVDPGDASALRRVALELQERFLGAGLPPASRPAASSGKPAGRMRKQPPGPAPANQGEGAQNLRAHENAEPAATGPPVVNAPLDFELRGLDPNHPYLKGRGFNDQTIEHFGLGYCARGLMQGRIAIPLHDRQGRLVGYAGRLVDDAVVSEEKPKYRFPGERQHEGLRHEFHKSLLLYNHHRITAPVADLVVVEGFGSVWWLHQNGYANVVALMGASCSREQAELIVGLVAVDGHVWAFMDGDKAGNRCAESVFAQVGGQRFVRSVGLQEGQQPTDCNTLSLSFLLPPCCFEGKEASDA